MAEKQEARNVKKVKRNIIIAAVLLFVCAAVYLNWSYNNSWGAADPAMVKAEDEKMTSLGGETDAEPASDYFAQARLTRQTSRDEALSLLETAASSESASQETIDSAMNAIAAMANWSMLETQLENTLIAKDFSDCVVYISEDGVTVAVPAPAEGLSAAAAARITEAVTSAGYTADQLNVIEIRSGSPSAGTGEGETDTGSAGAEDSETLTETSPAPQASTTPQT
jgi:stage III sporulation protein AH